VTSTDDEEKQFSIGLFYRLNVFPLRYSSAARATEDIPLLVRYFSQKYAAPDGGDESRVIPAAAMRKLMRWHWPGKRREPQNLVGTGGHPGHEAAH